MSTVTIERIYVARKPTVNVGNMREPLLCLRNETLSEQFSRTVMNKVLQKHLYNRIIRPFFLLIIGNF